MADEENVMCRTSFQYCFIRWNISHFSLLSCSKKYEICSPEFSVNYPATTKWHLGLRSTCTDNMGDLSIFLKRLPTDSGPEIVLVRWKAFILGQRNKKYFSSVYEGEFKENKEVELALSGYPEIQNDYYVFNLVRDARAIRCDLIVDHDLSSEWQCDPKLDPGLKSLSGDLKRLYIRSLHSDLVLRIGETSKPDTAVFRVHRAILAVRNAKIFNNLKEQRWRKELRLDGEFGQDNGDAVNRVLSYLYTGDINYIIKNPTIPVIQFTEFLMMEEIKPFFPQQQFTMTTDVQSDELEYYWIIKKFAKENKDYMHSEGFQDDDEVYGEWRLHLYTRGEDRESSYMAIYIEYLGGPGPLDVVVKYSVIGHNYKDHDVRVYGRIDITGRIGITEFFPRDKLYRVLKRDELHIYCNIYVSLGHAVSLNLPEKEVPRQPPEALNLYYSSLASSVKQLLVRKVVQDVVLKTRVENFDAHRSILAARSKKLASLLRKTKGSVVELNTSFLVLYALLKYMYSGEVGYPLDDISLPSVRRMYKAAADFGIPALQVFYSEVLQNMFSTDTVTEILELAESRQDSDLHSAACAYISNLIQNGEERNGQ